MKKYIRFIWVGLIFSLLISPGAFAGSLSSITITPQDGEAGEQTIYQFDFTNATTIPNDGEIRLTFPSAGNFDLSGVIIASSANTSTMNGGFTVSVASNVVTVTRDGTGGVVTPGSSVQLQIAQVTNSSTIGSHSIDIETYDGVTQLDNGTGTVTMTGSIATFTMDQSVSTQTAGASFSVSISNARDSQGNLADGVVSISGVGSLASFYSPDGTAPIFVDVQVTGGAGSANQTLYKAGSGFQLKGTVGSTEQTTNSFNVNDAGIHHFDMDGVPSSITAGSAFPSSVTVTAQDEYDNTVTGYSGQTIQFSSDDPNTPTLPSPYTMQVSDNGSKIFSGTDFGLNAAGSRTLNVSDGTYSLEAPVAITVNKGPIANFNVNINPTTPIAGQLTTISVSNAQDAGGNTVDGVVTFYFKDGGNHNAPDGTTYTLPQITLSQSGSGSGNAYFFKAEQNVILTAQSGTFTKDTSPISVSASQLNQFGISGLPSSAMAGQPFLNPVTITALDEYENIITNFAGTVFFSCPVDPNADLPNLISISPAQNGTHTFAGSEFTLMRAGTSTIVVQSGSVSTNSSSISVYAGSLNSFDISVNPTIVPQEFMVNINNAVDIGGNRVDTQVNLSFAQGSYASHIAPDGTEPNLPIVAVSNGAGQQIINLYKAEDNVVIRGTSGNVTGESGTVSVPDAGMQAFQISNTPLVIQEGLEFPDPVNVSAIDQYENIVKGFIGTISFNSTDTNAQLPSSYTFGSIDEGQHNFSGDEFKLFAKGDQTISVTGPGYSGTSSNIRVVAGQLVSFDFTVAPNPKVGEDLLVSITNAVDGIGNPVSADFTVTYADAGDHLAPNGYQPYLPAINVVNGQGQKMVRLVKAEDNVQLKASFAGIVDSSDVFDVSVGDLNSFDMSGLPTQINSGETFPNPVLITAFDEYKNEKTDYAGTISFSSTDNLAQLPNSVLLNDTSRYEFSGADFVLNSPGTQKVIVSDLAASVSDSSGFINVRADSMIQITKITTSQPAVTKGQTLPWFVTVHIKNNSMSNLELDFSKSNTFLTFSQKGQAITNQFSIVNPTVFSGGTTFLNAQETDSIKFTINSVSELVQPGTPFIFAQVKATNGAIDNSNRQYGTIWVQTEANVKVIAIEPSQSTVTAGDVTHNWYVDVILRNSGESDASIDFFQSSLSFSNPSGFSINPPSVLRASQTSVLTGTTVDTIRYSISRTGSTIGSNKISASLYITEINTNNSETVYAEESVKPTINIQNPSNFTISKIKSSQKYISVNEAPSWYVTVHVENGLDANNAAVELDLGSAASWLRFYDVQNRERAEFVTTQPTELEGSKSTILNGGQKDSLVFTVTTQPQILNNVYITGQVTASETNRPGSPILQAVNLHSLKSDTVVFQTPAEIIYVDNSLMPKSVSQRMDAAFTIDLQNSGDATLNLDADNTTLAFNDGNGQSYSVDLDDSFPIDVPGNQTTTIHFKEDNIPTDFEYGVFAPTVMLVGSENGSPFSQTLDMLDDSIRVEKPGDVAIRGLKTSSSTVSLGQATNDVKLDLLIENIGTNRLKLDSAKVSFYQDTENVSQYFEYSLFGLVNGGSYIQGGETDTLRLFLKRVKADAPIGKILLSTIAYFTDELQANRLIEAELDLGASLVVQKPANLVLSLELETPQDSVLTNNQYFNVFVKVENIGEADTEKGMISLKPPTNYQIMNGDLPVSTDLAKEFKIPDGEQSIIVPYTLVAPSIETIRVPIIASIVVTPIEKNRQVQAAVTTEKDTVFVKTKNLAMDIDSYIASPEGATDKTISSEQEFTLRSIISISDNVNQPKAKLILPSLQNDYAFSTISPVEVALSDAESIVEWKIKAPKEALGSQTSLYVELSANYMEGNVPTTRTKLDSITDITIVNKAKLLLDELQFVSPEGVMQDGKAYLSIGQQTVLQTRVVNTGDAKTLGSGIIKLNLLQSGLEQQAGEVLQKTFKVDSLIRWNLRANADSVILSTPIRAELVDIPIDENTGQKAFKSNSTREVSVQTDSIGWITVNSLEITYPTGASDDTLSTGQQFVVQAEISSERIKNDNMIARLKFSSADYQILQKADVDVPAGIKRTAQWQVNAPDDDRFIIPDTMWVEIDAFDKRSDIPLIVSEKRRPIWIEPKASFSLEPKISYPEGLTNNVSTGQEFHVTGEITHFGAEYDLSGDFQAQITVPEIYSLVDSPILTVTADTVSKGYNPTWILKAPNDPTFDLSKVTINLNRVPNDINSGKMAHIQQGSAFISLRTIDKAEIEMHAYINDNMGADSAFVRIRNDFYVSAMLTNVGVADIDSTFKIRLELPNDDYVLKSDTTLTGYDINSVLTWTVAAPQELTHRADTLKLYMEQRPLDKFAQQPATVLDTMATVIVFTEIGKVKTTTFDVGMAEAASVGKTGLSMMGLAFQNKDALDDVNSVIEQIDLSFVDKSGAPVEASSVVSRVFAVNKIDEGNVLAETVPLAGVNNVLLDFTNTSNDTISGAVPDSIEIKVDISDNALGLNFKVQIDSSKSIKVSDVLGDTLVLADSSGSQIDFLGFSSNLAVVLGDNLSDSFINYPNPFGKVGVEETKFSYYLKEDSDVGIKIFTLTGELVKFIHYTKSGDTAGRTQAGLHNGEISWDGRNGNGAMVRNGVYLAIFQTEYGEEATLKIAVVK